MIAKKAKGGSRAAGLLYYLYGPGKANEHTDPHMVAAWDGGVLDPARSSGATIPSLAMLLEAPVAALDGKPPAQHVYHVPVRLDPGDRILSDDEFADVAREIMDAVGIAKKGDPMGARWVAVRHADDHIHIVATLARQDGRVPDVRRDYKKMQARARELEKRYGLRRLSSGDKTASRWPTSEELGKAERHGRDETPRETLQRRVREAAAGARSDGEFFAAIEQAGIRLRKRVAPDGTVTGYSVALPGDRTGAGRAVWFPGTKLAPDLSLPRVRERWGQGGAAAGMAADAVHTTSRAAAWQLAAEHVHQAAAVLGQAGNAAGAGEVTALADFLATFAAQAPAAVRDELRAAAHAFERAGRAPTSRRMDSQANAHLRTATQLVALGAAMVADGGEAAAAIALLAAVALAITAAMKWHQVAQHAAQEHAAARAGTHLRAATEAAYGASSGHGSAKGSRANWRHATTRAGSPALSETYASVVRSALPHLAETILGEAAWPALAATIRQVENAGHNVAQVLAEVAGARGFSDAESTAEVLVWRLQRRMDNDTRATSTVVPPGRAPLPSTVGTTEPMDGAPVRWSIGHSDFVNEADVYLTDAEGTGTIPAGMTAEEFAEARLREFAAGRDPSRFSIAVMAAGAGAERLAHLPEGAVTAVRAAAETTDDGDEGTARAGTGAAPPPVVTRAAGAAESTPLGVGPEAPTFGAAVRRAVPQYAADVLADPASATLAAYLIKAAGESHQPVELLVEVAGARDLADADSVAQVLVWRLQGRLHQEGDSAPLTRITGRRSGTPTSTHSPRHGELTAPDRAAQEAARSRNQPRGPRR
ncbi:relaxase/mobilization nuclease domain-containing protein [Actinacidiphila sp. bgisy144]|uniref:relaxase/mobilization nuclease domain-containing protein n=1 Tax=Actinacidiphila sp. bgisy144 TaxID=3413791 RepID=UPI003EBD6062